MPFSVFYWGLQLLLVAASVPTDAYSTRLVGGSVSTEGRVEVYRNFEWQTLCDDSWDLNEADVVCRTLGYGYAIRAVGNGLFGQGVGGQWEAFFYCTGSESDLEDCSTGSSHCLHSEDAGVVCSGTSLQQGSLRLYGRSASSSSLYAGRVEIYISGGWGTVCDDGWGNNEANVACKQMGFAGASDSNWTYSSSGSNSQTIWLDNVECTGSETRLINCIHLGLGVGNCGHSEDIGVQCTQLTGSTVRPETNSVTVPVTSPAPTSTSPVDGIVGGVVAMVVPAVLVFVCVCTAISYSRRRRRFRSTRNVPTTAVVHVAAASTQQQPVYPAQANYQPTVYPPPAQANYPQQAVYPPQTRYPPQTGYPPQTRYPPQTGYPAQPDYPQQTGYPAQSDDPPPYSQIFPDHSKPPY